MENSEDQVQITAQCLCKRHTFTTAVPRSSLPLKATACHCTSCRKCTGALYSSAVLKWPGDGAPIRDSALKRYGFSRQITVLFCEACSGPMFFELHAPHQGVPEGATEGRFGVMTGALSNDGPDGLVRMENHVFVGDTKDGGASVWMRNPNGDGVAAKRWMGSASASEEVPFDWPGDPGSETEAQSKAAEIPIRCHCGGVDLVFQLQKAEEEFMGKAKSELPWFVHPETNKLMASIDPCDSCRLSSGVDFWTWTFILLRHIGFASKPSSQNDGSFPDDSKELKVAVSKEGPERDPRLGTLAYYASSRGVQRYFCAHCSASVFYAVDNRPDMVDVAVGLLDSADGARAESLLSWSMARTPKLLWRDDMSTGWRKQWLESVEAEAEEHRKTNR